MSITDGSPASGAAFGAGVAPAARGRPTKSAAAKTTPKIETASNRAQGVRMSLSPWNDSSGPRQGATNLASYESVTLRNARQAPAACPQSQTSSLVPPAL